MNGKASTFILCPNLIKESILDDVIPDDFDAACVLMEQKARELGL